jgi:AGCS family alanine or glycine:cation symporter
MYYIRDGLKSPFWASIFCLVTIFAALTVGNMTQVNSFILSLPTSWIEGATNHLAPLLGMDGSHHHWLVPAILGLGVSLFLGLTFLGGVHCFAVISSILVPLMAVAYFLGCGVVLIKYYDQILPSLWLILRSSLGMEAMAGGVGGYTIMRIIQVGFNRGLFATDAGAGLEAMLHATVSTVNDDDPKDAFRQGLISAIAPIVVAFLCTITALVLLTTGVWTDPTLASSTMCIRAFSTVFGPYANGFMCFIIGCFAITTIMTWSFCCDRAVEFLIKKPSSFGKILFLMVAPLGAMIQVHHVWTLGDIAFNSMLMINLVAVARLSPKVLPQIRSWINSF